MNTPQQLFSFFKPPIDESKRIALIIKNYYLIIRERETGIKDVSIMAEYYLKSDSNLFGPIKKK